MKWEIGQNVEVQSRTWPGINKPGGCAKIIKVHITSDGNYTEGLDVKYLLGGGCEMKIDPAIVSPIETLERGKRARRGREFLMKREDDVKAEGKGRSQIDSSLIKKKKPNAKGAKKANIPSPQSSATFSTPRKRRKIDKKPTKVTPIPKMVTTKKKIDFVSPMLDDTGLPPNAHLKNGRSKDSVARGLVFDKFDEIDQQQNRAKVKQKILWQSNHQSKQEQDRSKNDIHKRSAASNNNLILPRNHTNSNSVARNTITPKSSINRFDDNLSRQKERKNDTNNTVRSNMKSVGVRLKSNKDTKLSDLATAKAQIRSPRYKLSASSSSFSRTKSAYDKNKNALSSRAVSEENRKPLLDVYRREKEKAIEFMNEMIGHPTQHEIGNNANNDGQSKIAPASLKENTSFMSTNSQYGEFLSHVYKVWCEVNEEEVSVVKFQEIFQVVTLNLFSVDELDKHIKSYCDEGKEVMLSDGVMYRIN